MNAAPPSRALGPPSPKGWRLAGWAAALLLLAPAAAAAGSPTDDDLRLTVVARRALFEETKLAGLPLGVTVHHGTAILWGSAPNAEVIRLALDRLRHTPGLAGACSEVLLETWTEPAPGAAADPAVAPAPPCTSPAPTSPKRAPGELAAQAGPHGRAPGFVSAATAEPQSPAVSLGRPVAAAEAPVAARPRPAAELQRPVPVSFPPAPEPTSDLAAVVEQLRRGDVRFYGLRAEVRGQTVHVSGRVRAGEDITAFAQAAGRLPGVGGVVVGSVQVDPRP